MNPMEFKYGSAALLLQELCRQEKENFVFSPLSLGTCLAMAAVGLKGESKAELLDFLRAPDEDALHSAFADLLSNDEKPLKIANKIIATNKYEVIEQAVSFLRTTYKSEIDCADFTKDGRDVERRVNAWVCEKTQSKIPQLLPENILKPETILVLVNAIYFKAKWDQDFDSLNEKQDFQLRNGDIVKRDFMKRRTTMFTYKETDKLRLVRMPYREAPFGMILAIPKNRCDNIDEVIAETPPCELAATIDSMRQTDVFYTVILSMPKFKIEYSLGGLPNRLTELGVSKMFQVGQCDLGNLFAKVDRPPYISEIIHKAMIEVNERGTEAAAATATLGMVGSCGGYKPPPEVEVIIDRPFSFWIISANDMVSFTGICANP